MDEKSIERVEELAEYIDRFRQLENDEQVWIAELLKNGRLVRTCLNVLVAIATESLTYQEIADICDLHVNTVKQIVYALQKGGVDILEQKTGKYIAPGVGGRSRRLNRKM